MAADLQADGSRDGRDLVEREIGVQRLNDALAQVVRGDLAQVATMRWRGPPRRRPSMVTPVSVTLARMIPLTADAISSSRRPSVVHRIEIGTGDESRPNSRLRPPTIPSSRRCG